MFFFYFLSIKNGADVTRKNRDGHTPLDLVKESDQDVADLLRGDSALLEAAKKGNLARVQKLLTQENINCRDSQVRFIIFKYFFLHRFSPYRFRLTV